MTTNSFDAWAFAYAKRCLENTEKPLREIDIDEFAMEKFNFFRSMNTVSREKDAIERFIYQFRRAYHMLMPWYDMLPVYREILCTVVDNGRLKYYTEDELEEEISYEARELGLSDKQIAEAVAYAKEYYDVEQHRDALIAEALQEAIIAAQEVAGVHPDPRGLLSDLEVQYDSQIGEFLAIVGHRWEFWPPKKRDEAFKAAEKAFRAALPWLN